MRSGKRLAENGKMSWEEGKSTLQVLSSSVTFGGILVIAALISMVSGNVESTIVIILLSYLMQSWEPCSMPRRRNPWTALNPVVAQRQVMRDGHKINCHRPGGSGVLEAGTWWLPTEGYWKIIPCRSMKAPYRRVHQRRQSDGRCLMTAPWQTGPIWYIQRPCDYGRAVVLVTATGMDTEIGKIAALMNATKEKNPLRSA
ncbi:hypothetical protein [Enterocloster sp.]|uniref:hypothetical protein n=1 Tax=Enterocloster sp. TaxID=2719315 RepID=UPI00399FAC2E